MAGRKPPGDAGDGRNLPVVNPGLMRAFSIAISSPMAVSEPGFVHLHPAQEPMRKLASTAMPAHFVVENGDRMVAGAMLSIEGPASGFQNHAQLPSELVDSASGSVVHIIPNFSLLARPPSDGITAFAQLLLLEQPGGRNVLFVPYVQKSLVPVESSREGRAVHADPNQGSQGATRHHSLIDAAMEIAVRMAERGQPVEVHVPHPSAIPAFNPAIRSRIVEPFEKLAGRHPADELEVGPARIRTVNLSRRI